MPKANTTTVALIQMRCSPDTEKNFARAVGFIRDAAKKGAQIVCLPELFRSQYFCQTEDHKNFALAEEVPGRSTSDLGDVARELGVVIVASLFEKRTAGVYHNTAAIIDADGAITNKETDAKVAGAQVLLKAYDPVSGQYLDWDAATWGQAKAAVLWPDLRNRIGAGRNGPRQVRSLISVEDSRDWVFAARRWTS